MLTKEAEDPFIYQLTYVFLLLLLVTVYFPFSLKVAGFNLQLAEVLAGCLFVLYMLSNLFYQDRGKGQPEVSENRALVYLSTILLVVFFISTIFAENHFDSFKGFVKWAMGIGAMFVIAKPLKVKDWLKLFYTFLHVGNAVFFMMISKALIFGNIDQSGIKFLGLHPNLWGQFAVYLLCLNFTLLLFTSRRVYSGLFTVISAFALILSFSIASWAAAIFLVMIITLYYIYRHQDASGKTFKLVLALAAFALILFLGFLLFKAYFPSRIHSLELVMENPLEYRTMEERYTLWGKAFELARGNFWGIGFYNLQYHTEYVHTHNIFFDILYSTGFVGLAVFILFLAVLIRRLFGLMSKEDELFIYKFALFWSVISYLMTNNFSAPFSPSGHWLFWIGAGLILASGNMGKGSRYEKACSDNTRA